MSQFFQIHPETPQKRLIKQAVEIIRKGGVVVYPTDSGYALGCHLGDKQAADKIKRIRRLDEDRKSTRLNSSHVRISYAVFCLKKKKKKQKQKKKKKRQT